MLRPPRSTRTDTRGPYATLLRSALAQSVDVVVSFRRSNDLSVEGLAGGRIAGLQGQFVHDKGLNTLASVGQAVRRIDRGWVRHLSPVINHANAAFDRSEVVELTDDGDSGHPFEAFLLGHLHAR